MSMNFKEQPLKSPSESETITTLVVFPNDTNPMGRLHGGRLIQWMDDASAVCAQTHAEQIAVTVALDRVLFRSPANTGDIITIKARVTRAFNSSMEIFVQAWARRVLSKEKHLINEAYFTFVAIDGNGAPVAVPEVAPETAEEKTLYEDALLRKLSRSAAARKP